MKFGVWELIIILVVVLILFGPTQIPKLTKMFGKSVKGFQDGLAEAGDEPAADRGGAAPETGKPAQGESGDEKE